ncbi:V-type ATP synthase subunit C [Clostridium sp.]|uniref:V-type ATP synthase subunit C n=1 Tax=Clostridium sp. TaxID=1506 RepID=UPI002FC97A55
MDRMDFTHAVARLRVIEKRLLDKVKIERLLECETPEEVLKVLQETQYGEKISNVKDIHIYENMLRQELKDLYETMYKLTPEKSVIDIMSLKYDYHNIKVLEKGKSGDKDLSNLLIPIGTIPEDTLKTIILSGEFKALNPLMREAVTKVESIFSMDRDPQNIDIILDKYMYKDMLQRALATEIEFIIEYVKISIDITNIKTMLRVKKQNKDARFLEDILIEGGTINNNTFIYGLNESLESFINSVSKSSYTKALTSILEDYNRTGNFSPIEVIFDNYIIDKAKSAKRVNFGPEPLIAFIIAKENEIKIVRIILVGKINKVPTEIIKGRLREIYA